MALMTWSVDIGENALREKPGFTWLKVGGDALLVLSLTLETFSMKNRLNASASIADDAVTLPRPSSASPDFHSLRGSFDRCCVHAMVLKRHAEWVYTYIFIGRIREIFLS